MQPSAFPAECLKVMKKTVVKLILLFLKKDLVHGIELVRRLENTNYVSLNSSTSLHNYLHNTSISCKIDELYKHTTSQKEIECQNNRLIMSRLIDIVICLVKGGRPFRGHDEKSQRVNQGLFKKLVNLLSKYDTVLKKTSNRRSKTCTIHK